MLIWVNKIRILRAHFVFINVHSTEKNTQSPFNFRTTQII